MKIGSYQQLFRIFRLYLTVMSSHKKQVYCGSVPQVLQLSLPGFHLEAGWWQHWWQNKKYHPLMGVAIKNRIDQSLHEQMAKLVYEWIRKKEHKFLLFLGVFTRILLAEKQLSKAVAFKLFDCDLVRNLFYILP